jgi:hypothetical protein
VIRGSALRFSSINLSGVMTSGAAWKTGDKACPAVAQIVLFLEVSRASPSARGHRHAHHRRLSGSVPEVAFRRRGVLPRSARRSHALHRVLVHPAG